MTFSFLILLPHSPAHLVDTESPPTPRILAEVEEGQPVPAPGSMPGAPGGHHQEVCPNVLNVLLAPPHNGAGKPQRDLLGLLEQLGLKDPAVST